MKFKALLRGFKDLSDGSQTAILDIPEAQSPDSRLFRQKWGYFTLDNDEKVSIESLKAKIDACMSLLMAMAKELQEMRQNEVVPLEEPEETTG